MSHAAVPAGAQDRVSPAPWLALLLVLCAGAAASWVLSAPAPESPGARRLASPEVLLGAFDALLLVLLAAGPPRRTTIDTLLLLVVAAPFHAALAAAADAGPGHLAAVALSAAAWAGAALVVARSRTAARPGVPYAALATFALPLAAYGIAEFVRLPARSAFLASPLTGPVLLARRAATAAAADAVPAIVAAGLVAALAGIAGRRAPGAAG